MKHTPKTHRIAIAALSAALVLPIAPVFGQDAPVASPPPVVSVSPPPPVFVAPPPPVMTAPPPVARPAPPPVAEARPATRTTRTATRTRVAAPVRRAAPAPAPVAAAPAPPPPVAAPVAPVAELPAPVPVEPAAVPVETPAAAGGSILPWLLAGGALLIALIGFLAIRRRRAAADEVYEETYHEEPAIVAAEPAVVATPAMAAAHEAEEAGVEEAGESDVAALAADSEPVAGRPWLEFLMRPVRAGTSSDDAIVQFELTVGNTGNMPAKDVKISTWMFAAGQGTEMERSLIEPPAGATVSEVDIAAGDGARVDGEFALSKADLHEPVLPVVVADARYRLPDGSEGRTSASFAIGMTEGDELVPFPIDRASGLFEDVEARLHGEPQRV